MSGRIASRPGVRAARRADAVRKARAVAARAAVRARACGGVRRAPLVAPGAGSSLLRNGHVRPRRVAGCAKTANVPIHAPYGGSVGRFGRRQSISSRSFAQRGSGSASWTCSPSGMSLRERRIRDKGPCSPGGRGARPARQARSRRAPTRRCRARRGPRTGSRAPRRQCPAGPPRVTRPPRRTSPASGIACSGREASR